MPNDPSIKPDSVTPVQPSERIQFVDVLRGFALFGILFVNMELFSHPFQSLVLPADPASPWIDRAAIWLVHFLGEGKFYSLFSLLFGLGLALQMERVEARGGRFVPLYLRRLLVLFAIGAGHAFLIWVGDILLVYAVGGLILILFRKARPRTLLIWVVVLLAIPLALNGAATALIGAARAVPEAAPEVERALAEVRASYVADAARANQVYATGTFAEVTAQRVYDYVNFSLAGTLYALGFNVLAMFLVGLYFGQRRLLHDSDAHRPFFRRLLIWGLGLGLIGNALYATLIMPLARYEISPTLLAAIAAQGIGAPLLSLGYLSGLALLYARPAWRERLNVLAPVGRMALTNYLSQSIICTLIFYGYGLGLFGQVGTALGILLTIVIYGLQIPLSHWWLKRFRFGPAEWLWRSLVYLQAQPMRRS